MKASRERAIMLGCEFCTELDQREPSRFSSIYGHHVRSRIIARYKGFVAIPTLGQLFPGSLLVLPTEHIETCAQLPANRLEALSRFIDALTPKLRKFGDPIYFEHGSTARAAASCGIYHAHIHLVPLPYKLAINEIFPEHTRKTLSLGECLTNLCAVDHYLIIGDISAALYDIVSGTERQFPSQFFRRRLTEIFSLNRYWDWRTYRGPEDDVIATIRAYQTDTAINV